MTEETTRRSESYDDASFDAEFEALPSATLERPVVAAPRPSHIEGHGNAPKTQRLGLVIGGSLSKGLDVRLERLVSTEELAVGSYAVVRGQRKRFFSMITDVLLGVASEDVLLNPPDLADDFLREVHLGTSTFGLLHLSPMLVLEQGEADPRPVKTVPGHFSEVRSASQEEVSEVFGEEGFDSSRGAHFFHVGQPLDMGDVKVTLSLERLVERSSGVFGKSGTGKTFLSRLLLAGIIRDRVAVNLIFDMHNEYGWEGSSEGASGRVKGLKQIFPDGRVSIFTLDDESSRRRGSNPDYTITIGYDQVEPDDVEMLQGILNLSEPQVGAIFALHRQLKRDWLANFLNDAWIDALESFDPDTGKGKTGLQVLADDLAQPFQTLAALRRRLMQFERYGFLRPKAIDDRGSHPEVPRCRHERRVGVWALRQQPGRLPFRSQLPNSAHPSEVRREERKRLRQPRRRAYAAGDHDRGSAQVPRSGYRWPYHLRDDRRAAQIQRDSLYRRRAAQPNRFRGDEPDRHARHGLVGRRKGHPGGVDGRQRRGRVEGSAGAAGDTPAGADPGPRRADAGGGADAQL